MGALPADPAWTQQPQIRLLHIFLLPKVFQTQSQQPLQCAEVQRRGRVTPHPDYFPKGSAWFGLPAALNSIDVFLVTAHAYTSANSNHVF